MTLSCPLSSRVLSPLFFSVAAAGLLLVAGCGGAEPGAGPSEGALTQADSQSKLNAPVAATRKGFELSPAQLDQAAAQLGPGPDETYSVMLLWGQVAALESAPPAPVVAAFGPRPVMSWKGSLRVVDGEISVARTVDAHGQSGDVKVTAESKTIVNFEAQTGANVEGVLVHVRVPSKHAVMLFTTEQLTAFVDLHLVPTSPGQQAAMDDGVHGLVWAGFRDEGGCDRRGFLYGPWADANSAGGGTFGASVIDERGLDMGRANGSWSGPSADVKGMFAGQVTGKLGTPVRTIQGELNTGRGQLSGTWAPTDGGSTGRGTVDGIFRTGHGAGVWLGRWTESCGIGG